MKRSLLLLALLAAVPSQAAMSVRRHVLANGLTIVLHEDRKAPLVTSYIWYKVGSRDERPGKSGFAHLFEHFMFEGSEHVHSGECFRFATRVGGEVNASTSFDRTDYYFTVPSERLEEVLRIESDRMGFLQAGMTDALLQKQIGIVLNEKRQGDNAPYNGAFERLFQNAFPAGHPYAKLPIGSAADLNAATVADAKAFHSSYYWPNNAVLVISGDHDSDATLAMINKWFGGIRRGPAPPPSLAANDAPPSVARDTMEDAKAQVPLLVMAWRIPGKGKPGNAEMSVLANLLANGRASRLIDALQVRSQVLLEVSAGVMGLELGDLLLLDAKPAPGVTLAQAEAAIDREIAAMLNEGVDERRLRAMAKGLEARRLNALQSAQGLASALAEGQARDGDPLSFESEIDAVRAMRPEAIVEAGRLHLAPSKRTILTVTPKVTP